MATYKTPGVYVEEIALFPPSVAEVATAVPAFIGYTEKAERKGEDLTNKPTRLRSLLEYREYFGGEFEIEDVDVQVDASLGVTKVSPQKRFYLFESLRLFFDNGGGACYIVSVGSYEDDVVTDVDGKGLKVGLAALRKYDEPTIILYPDAPLLAEAGSFYSLQQLTLKQCAELQDRVAVFDLRREDQDLNEAVTEFRNKIGINNLKYGAAYTPWLYTSYPKEVDFGIFKDNVTDAGNAAVDLALLADPKLLVDKANIGASNVDAVAAVGSPDALEDTYERRRDDVRKAGDAGAPAALAAAVTFVRGVILDAGGLDAAVTGDNLPRDLESYVENTLKDAVTKFIGLDKNVDVRGFTGVADNDAVDALFAAFPAADWLDGDVSAIGPSAVDYALNDDPVASQTASNILEGVDAMDPSAVDVASLNDIWAEVLAFLRELNDAADAHADLAQKTLYEDHKVIGNIVEQIKRELSRVPPSGAIVGLYSYVDNTRGVWKAPANVSVASVNGPTDAIDFFDQEDLNIDVNGGKSINAIRDFTGRGTIVWGARTLAGNDNEWRYIPVRRFFNMVEESVKKSTSFAVFEPNDASLWVKVKGMIENYLIQKWRQGALQGSTPEQAFFVKIGLGETMTAQDILEGRLIVEIGMAVVRPAEFIILRFMHKLPEA